jgi:hypothetical protein
MAILALDTKVIDIPKGVRGEISIFPAYLTRFYDYKGNIQILLYQ